MPADDSRWRRVLVRELCRMPSVPEESAERLTKKQTQGQRLNRVTGRCVVLDETHLRLTLRLPAFLIENGCQRHEQKPPKVSHSQVTEVLRCPYTNMSAGTARNPLRSRARCRTLPGPIPSVRRAEAAASNARSATCTRRRRRRADSAAVLQRSRSCALGITSGRSIDLWVYAAEGQPSSGN